MGISSSSASLLNEPISTQSRESKRQFKDDWHNEGVIMIFRIIIF